MAVEALDKNPVHIVFLFSQRTKSPNKVDQAMMRLQRILPGITSILVRGTAAGLSLLLGVVVARMYGPVGAGIFYLALSTLLYATSLSRIGADQTLIRKAAQADENDHAWYGLYSSSLIASALVGLAASLAIYFSLNIATFKQASYQGALILCLGVLPNAIIWINAGALQGKGAVHRAVFLQAICIPAIALPLMLTLSGSVDSALWCYLGATYAGCLISFAMIFRRFGMKILRTPPVFKRDFFRSSANLAVVSMMNIAQNWLPITLAALFVSTHDVGLLSAAMRISAVGALVLTALNSYSAPIFAKLHATNDVQGLQSRLQEVSALGFALGSPMILILVLFPHWVIALFGPEFQEAAVVLVILSIGQLVVFATGSGTVLLAMTGHDRDLKNATVLSVVVMAIVSVLGLAVTKSYFAVAWASTIAVAAQNVLICNIAKRKLGVTAWFDPVRLLRRPKGP